MRLATLQWVCVVVIRAQLAGPVRECIQISATGDIDVAMRLMQ